MRARIAQTYESIELRRRLFLEKKIKSLDDSDWERILEMDEIMQSIGEANGFIPK